MTREPGGKVGDDAVDAERQLGVEFGGLVEGPDVDFEAVGVGVVDERGGHERLSGELGRDLERHHARRHRFVRQRAPDHREDVCEARAEGRSQTARGNAPAQLGHQRVLARSEQRARVAPGAGHQTERFRHDPGAAAFELEVEARVGKTSEGLFEARDAQTATGPGARAVGGLVGEARVQARELVPIEFGGGPGPAADALEGRVVEQDRDAVSRQLDVALEHAGARRERRLEGGEGVLRPFAGGAAVADHDRVGQREEWMAHRIKVSCAPMAVLTRDLILSELSQGRIRIDPFDPSQVGVASIDLTLGREIRTIQNAPTPIRVEDDTDYRDHTRVLSLDQPHRLDPGVTIHGITAEHITLPDDLCGFLEGRSRFARLGLMIHVTSAFVQPGVSNRQVLEMSNVSSRALEIVAGVRICQLVLMRTEGRAVYRGRFRDQRVI